MSHKPRVQLGVMVCFLVLLILAWGCQKAAKEEVDPADLVLINGSFFTADDGIPTAAAVAVRGETIAAVLASQEEAQKSVSYTHLTLPTN